MYTYTVFKLNNPFDGNSLHNTRSKAKIRVFASESSSRQLISLLCLLMDSERSCIFLTIYSICKLAALRLLSVYKALLQSREDDHRQTTLTTVTDCYLSTAYLLGSITALI